MKLKKLASAVLQPSLFAPLAASAQDAMVKGEVKKVDAASGNHHDQRRNYVSMTTMAAVIMISVSLLDSAAFAHPELQSVEPAAGAAATTSPKQIKITFTEAVIPQFSGAEIKDQTGKAIATGKAAVDPANNKVLFVPVNEQLPPGDYTVEWHAVSGDTHRVKGNYTFSVAR